MARGSDMAGPEEYARNRELRGKWVRYRCRHWTNSTTSFVVEKEGEYSGMVKHTVNFKGRKQMAVVHFDGNRRASHVPLMELEIVSPKKR